MKLLLFRLIFLGFLRKPEESNFICISPGEGTFQGLWLQLWCSGWGSLSLDMESNLTHERYGGPQDTMHVGVLFLHNNMLCELSRQVTLGFGCIVLMKITSYLLNSLFSLGSSF